MAGLNCYFRNEMANEDCLVHNDEHTKAECPDPDHFYCPCCFYYLPDEGLTGPFCAECMNDPFHQRPQAITARSVWNA